MSRFWTEAEMARLAELYPERPTIAVAQLLGRSLSGTYGMAVKLGLQKSPAFLASMESGRLHKGEVRPGSVASQFKKGQVPLNKGLRRPGWAPGRMAETQFKKGCLSGLAARLWKPIGTIRTDNEGYLRIKVRESIHGKEPSGFGNTKAWPLLNRYLWEKAHGPIPPKHVVCFKDRDRKNCVIENLELVSRADLARRNRMWVTLPRELAVVMQLNGALKRKLRKYGKEQNNGSSRPSI